MGRLDNKCALVTGSSAGIGRAVALRLAGEGARIALIRDDRSLLAAGIAKCEGDFHAGDVIDVFDSDGYAIARGETAFSSHEIRQIIGKSASEIEVLFPDKKRFEVIHRDAIVLL